MIKQCRYVLRGLRNLSTNTEDRFSFLDNSTCICLVKDYDQVFDYSRYQGEIHATIHQLILDGYLMPDDRNEYYFALTSKGLHPYRFQWEQIKLFLFRSVFVPIVVSVVTTLITMILQG